MEYTKLLEDINAYYAYDRDKQKLRQASDSFDLKKVKNIFKLVVT